MDVPCQDSLMNDLRCELHDRENSDEAKAILAGLLDFIAPYRKDEWREVTISFKNAQDEVVAGLNGRSSWGWLFVKLVWVRDDFRGQGLGRKLMVELEREAKNRGCRGIWLDTFSFQTPEFYQKLGYSIFGTLEECPPGYKRHFFQKKIN